MSHRVKEEKPEIDPKKDYYIESESDLEREKEFEDIEKDLDNQHVFTDAYKDPKRSPMKVLMSTFKGNYWRITKAIFLGSAAASIIMIAGTVIFALWFMYMFKKNIIDSSVTPFNVTPFGFSSVALPSYFGLCFILYFFTNHAPAIHLPFSEFKDFGTFAYIMTGSQWFEATLMFVTAVIFTVLYVPTRIRLMKINNNKIR